MPMVDMDHFVNSYYHITLNKGYQKSVQKPTPKSLPLPNKMKV